MKTLVLANQKGGVGKSAVAVQLAYFFNLIMKKRVLVIDLDHQRNTSKAIRTGEIAVISQLAASFLLSSKIDISDVDDAEFVLIPADNAELLRMEKQADKHNSFTSNLQSFLKTVQSRNGCFILLSPACRM